MTLIEADDSRVTTVALLLGGRDVGEQDFHRILLVQSRDRQATIMKRPGFPERHHFFGDRPSGFGLGQGGGNAFMFDQAANHVREHRSAMRRGAA